MTFWYNVYVILTNVEIKNLKDKKYRKNHGLFMVEGDKFCADLLYTDIQIVYTITSLKDLDGFPNIVVVSDKLLSSISTTKTNQNIICICKIKKFELASIGNALILDNLQDPGNVGTLVRSALAFGFKDIYLVGGADVYSEKVIRASAGTILKARLHIVDFETIKNNKNLIAESFLIADMDGENINTFKTKSKVAVVIGNEGQGVSDEFITLADKTISIPMENEIESLNAGVAGSIIMQKINSQKNMW